MREKKHHRKSFFKTRADDKKEDQPGTYRRIQEKLSGLLGIDVKKEEKKRIKGRLNGLFV